MSKSMKDLLKKSVENESYTVSDKLKSFSDKSDRFKKAETFFDDSEKPTPQADVVKKDIFSFPLQDYELIDKCIGKAINLKTIMNKSEIVRAGLKCLDELSDDEFLAAINKVEKIKKGRK